MEDSETKQGEKLLSAVERLLADDAALIALVERHVQAAGARGQASEAEWLRQVARRIVSEYSTKSAISGGVTALPSLVPGFGTVVTLVGGSLADMALMLKFEVELALCLSQLYGHDLRDPQERQFAFLLASVSTYEAKTNQNLFLDLASAQGTAIWNYTPRQVSKRLLSVMARIALLNLSKSLGRLLPVVGVVVGASANKVLTTRVGERCIEELARRRELAGAQREKEKKTTAKTPGARAKATTRRAKAR